MHKYKEGELVYVRPLSRLEKEQYTPGWHQKMDEYEGQTLEIVKCFSSDRYRLKGAERWAWTDENLELASVFDAF